jgi:hypothetical protein
VVSPLRPLEGPACPICGEGLDAERLKIGAKTCAKPECARERKRRRDAAAKGRHGSSTSRGENSLPEQDGLGAASWRNWPGRPGLTRPQRSAPGWTV